MISNLQQRCKDHLDLIRFLVALGTGREYAHQSEKMSDPTQLYLHSHDRRIIISSKYLTRDHAILMQSILVSQSTNYGSYYNSYKADCASFHLLCLHFRTLLLPF